MPVRTLELLCRSVKCQSGQWNSPVGPNANCRHSKHCESVSLGTEFSSSNSIHIRYVLIAGAAIDLQESCQLLATSCRTVGGASPMLLYSVPRSECVDVYCHVSIRLPVLVTLPSCGGKRSLLHCVGWSFQKMSLQSTLNICTYDGRTLSSMTLF